MLRTKISIAILTGLLASLAVAGVANAGIFWVDRM